MFVYLAHNWTTNEFMVIPETDLDKYKKEIDEGTIELIESYEIED